VKSLRTIAACHADAVAALESRMGLNDLAERINQKPVAWPEPIEGPNMAWGLLDSRIAAARADMGPERWAQLMAEWEA
jgi:hypothetical protein